MTTVAKPELREIPLSLIDEPTLPSRTTMDEQKLDELVASIRTLGFISVIVVVRIGDRYEVVAGHRRRIAAGRAGLVAIPCLVYASKAVALEAIQHAENRHREDLNVADEAIWFAQLAEAHPDEGTDGVAARVGESRDYVEGRLALLHGDERIFQALADSKISIGVAQQLNRCDDTLHRNMLLDLAVRNGATIGTVKGWIAEYFQVHRPAIGGGPAPAPVATGSPVLENEYFRCRLCRETENPAHMQSVQMHDYCIKAILEPALRHFQHRGDFVEFPRTREAAVALYNRIAERFPELLEETPAQP